MIIPQVLDRIWSTMSPDISIFWLIAFELIEICVNIKQEEMQKNIS